MTQQSLHTKADIEAMIECMAQAIVAQNAADGEICLVGIRTRGVTLAERIQAVMERQTGQKPPLGILDITLYRDDLTLISSHPIVHETLIDFDISTKVLVLVDDVIYTGRTIRAALDALVDLGRPHKVQLAALVDRGHRELPIQPDFVGSVIETQPDQNIKVILEDTDQRQDEIVILG